METKRQELKTLNELLDIVEKILKRGNTAEIKRERDNVVIVEIQRQVKIKTSING